ncbi:PSO2 [Sanghuangporus weigelae]
MSRKRKEQPQTSTLLNFFAAGSNGNLGAFRNKRKPESQEGRRESSRKTPRAIQEIKNESVNREWGAGDIDIIVIESDDEKEQGADVSSDVEVIQDYAPRQQESGSGESLLIEKEKSSKHSTNTLQALLRPSDKEPDGPEWDDSAPDEWELALADEELSVLANDLPEESYEDLNVGAEDPDEQPDENIDSCPMCTMTFLDLDPIEIQTHVNNCLDEPSSSARCSAIRKPLRPLASFPISAGSSVTAVPNPKLELKPKASSAFSVLMSGNSLRERAAWEEARKAEDRNFRPTKNERRKAPFYKVLTGMPIAVDAFRYGSIPGVEAYFLTHAHSDHYTNLSSNWKNGPIYCSETTANLIVHMLSVERKWLHPLPMNTPVEIPKTGGVKVTLIDANHCPGSCLFLFEGQQTINAGDSNYRSPFVGTSRIFRFLHCGDFRACPQQVLHPTIKGKRLDTVYLDTTYLNPKYCFPPQPLVTTAVAELARRIVMGEPLRGDNDQDGSANKGSIHGWMKSDEGKGKQKEQGKGDVLVVVGTYSIGKERVVKAIAKILGTRVYCDARKKAILHCQDDPELHALLTDKPLEAGVHVVPLGQVASDRFKEYMDRWKGRWTRAVAFRPTGWTYTPPAGSDPMPSIQRIVSAAQSRSFAYHHLKPARNSTSQLMQYGVPYSEHSSFSELACFALSIDCGRIVATVNVGSATSRAKMTKWVERWETERKRRKEAGLPVVVEYRHLDYW